MNFWFFVGTPLLQNMLDSVGQQLMAIGGVNSPCCLFYFFFCRSASSRRLSTVAVISALVQE